MNGITLRRWGLLAVFALAAGTLSTPAFAVQRAVLIGISKYSAFQHGTPTTYVGPALFPDLDCDEDVTLMKSVLVSKFHFTPDHDMAVLTTPEQTTRASILAALQRLIDDTKPGDVVFIHYSGHGSQVPDDTKSTGLEETIVPADYRDDQTNEITGHEIRAILAQLALKHPAQITVVVDACHSGGDARSAVPSVCRGEGYDDFRAWYEGAYGKEPPAAVPHPGLTAKAEDAVENGPWVMLSACDDAETAWETVVDGVAQGRFTYCLTRVLAHATPTTSYGQIFDEVRSMFQAKFSDQTPQLDGDRDLMVLGGQAAPPTNQVVVSPITNQTLSLSAGKIVGVTVGSKYDIIDSTGKTVGSATVTHVDVTTSVLTIDTPTAGLQAADVYQCHAVETTHNYPAQPLILDPQSVRTAAPAVANDVLDQLASIKIVSTDLPAGKTPDLILVNDTGSVGRGAATGHHEPGLYLERYDTHTVINNKPLVASNGLTDQLKTALIRYAQYTTALSLNQSDPATGVSATLRIVPAVLPDVDQYGKHSIWKADAPEVKSASYQAGTYFTLEVTNYASKPLHVAVLDIESDGDVSVAWPSPKYHGTDNIIPADGKPHRLWKEGQDVADWVVYQFSSADPNEVFKLIATDEYVDLSQLANVDKGVRGMGTPFDDLLEPAVSSRGISDQSTYVPPTSWATSDVAFAITVESH
ncbi:MAG: caspase domain-containing protein [Capsulimonadaceae bacterium]